MAVQTSLISQGNGQMGFSQAHAANKDDITFVVNEVQSKSVFDGLDLGEPCLVDMALCCAIAAQMDFGDGQFREVVDMVPLFLRGLFGKGLVIVTKEKEFKIFEMLR